jgi:peroxiredoxin
MKRLAYFASFALVAALLVAFVPHNDASIPEAAANAASADATVGEPAPNFTLQGTDGETYTLADLEGKMVVLEWLNFGCPYVQKHYGSGNMQALQEKYTEQGVVWLSVVSSAEGKQGYYPPEEMNAKNAEHGGQQTAILMDTSGEVGQAYGARTTPHMYIINPEGTLIYKGGIDDKPTTDEADIETATNYVEMALSAALNGEEVPVKTAAPYGCSVKYATSS